MKGKKIVLIVLTVAVVLLLGAGALLFQGISQFRDVSGQLNESRRRLDVLYQRNPFPTEENIALEMERLDSLRQELTTLMSVLADGQVEPIQTAASGFPNMFRETTRRLTEKAEAAGVTLPATFFFGFDHHQTGDIPTTADVPRLIQQLEIIEQLVSVLCEARITALTAVTRQEFEVTARRTAAGPAVAPGGAIWDTGPQTQPSAPTRAAEPPARMGILGSDDYFASMRFSLAFNARETALLTVLNKLADHPMFIVVTQIELDRPFVWRPVRAAAVEDEPGAGRPAGAQPRAGQAVAPPSRNARVVTGIEQPLNVKIQLEVYRFRKDKPS